MSDPDQEQTGLPPEGISLGGLAGGFDTSLGGAPAEPPPADDGPLPRSALLRFRQSGGLRFTTRAITVFRDGRVLPDDPAARARRLPPAALGALQHLLLRARLPRLPEHAPATAADGYVYELVARVGRLTCRVELADGAVPAEAERLLTLLKRMV